MHNFVTRDGTPPKEFRRIAAEQLQRYPAVELRKERVLSIGGTRGSFEVQLETSTVSARRVLLCTGLPQADPAPTLLAQQGVGLIRKPFRMKEHIERFYESLRYVAIDPGLSPDELGRHAGQQAVPDVAHHAMTACAPQAVVSPIGDRLVERHRADQQRQRRDRIRVGHGPSRPEPTQADVPGDVAEERGGEPEIEDPEGVAYGKLAHRVERRAAHEWSEADRADKARRGRQRQEVVAGQEWLEKDVVEREGHRCADDDQRALHTSERERLAGPERNDDPDAEQSDDQADQAPREKALETDGDGEGERQARRQRDDERGDPGGRVACSDVERDVVAHDDEDTRDDHPEGISPRQARKPSCPPEDQREAGRRDRLQAEMMIFQIRCKIYYM